ncbi:MAG: hypothetical protein EU535_06905 [Promethearchaeota archaeon]|nr:MAG: hypothetical protein EU535_06905 [Candidatus Lokiarchaeota archaeon]
MVSLETKLIEDPEEILKNLQIGIQMPILSEFHKYILRDFKIFKAKAILLLEDKNICGFVLLFYENRKLLNFGYFKTIDDEPDKISYLIDEIIKYAKLNNFQQIKGPINIPTVIYGWGFMEENSNSNLFACCPINPQIYQSLFYKKGFKKFLLQYNWEGILPRVNPWSLKEYNFEEYEYFNPKNYEDFNNLKHIFLKIQSEYLPSSSQVTPGPNLVFDSYAEYIFEFGFNFMIFFIRYKPTNQIVACGSFLPNPFRKNNKGNFDSCIVYTWAVIPSHRRKGLAMLMYGATSIQAWKYKIRYGIGPVGSNVKANMELGKKLGASIGRTYVVLEFTI